MKIALISHSDLRGGAAVVTYRLMNALRSEGHEAEMLVVEKLSQSPHVHLLGSSVSRKSAFLAERLQIFANNGFSRKSLFRVSSASTGMVVADNPLVKDADAILLGWVNQATLSLEGISYLCRLGKPVVWTMHDMWCITGICHHAYGCTRFHRECGSCKFLGRCASAHDLSHRVWNRKRKLFDEHPIRFVAVSHWVREQTMKSSLLQGRNVEVIHNAFDSKMFGIEPAWPIEGADGRRIIAFGAANLNDPVKGLDFAVDALNLLAVNHPEVSERCVALFFGEVRDKEPFGRLSFPAIIYGNVTDHETLRNIYANASVVLSTSLYECLPGTLIEGMSCGAVPVTFGEGGQSDIVSHLVDGYIARYLDVADVAEGILWALGCGLPRHLLHNTVEQRFGARLIASQYIDLLKNSL